MINPPTLNQTIVTSLESLRPGEGGWIAELKGPEKLTRRLMEMGMVEEAFVEVVHEAPFGRDPVAIKVRGSLLALRRQEAKHVSIRRVPKL